MTTTSQHEDPYEDITTTKTTDALADLLDHYCLTHSLPYQSADELLVEVLGRINELQTHVQWLLTFIDQWNAVQADEDFESAIQARGEK